MKRSYINVPESKGLCRKEVWEAARSKGVHEATQNKVQSLNFSVDRIRHRF